MRVKGIESGKDEMEWRFENVEVGLLDLVWVVLRFYVVVGIVDIVVLICIVDFFFFSGLEKLFLFYSYFIFEVDV